jgi:hypothetical protein
MSRTADEVEERSPGAQLSMDAELSTEEGSEVKGRMPGGVEKSRLSLKLIHR